MDVFCNMTQLVEKPEGPPDISSLIDYPRLTKKTWAKEPGGLPTQKELIDYGGSPGTPSEFNVIPAQTLCLMQSSA